MIPQSSTRYPVKWKTDPAEGTYQAQVQIHYDDDTKLATWSGTSQSKRATWMSSRIDWSQRKSRLTPRALRG